MKTLKEGVDLHTEYQTDSILWLRILTVHPAFNRRGIGRKLMELSIEMAKDHGAGAIETNAFSEFTFKAASRLGFETLSELDFATFELNGVRPYENDPLFINEHPKARFMARRISYSE